MTKVILLLFGCCAAALGDQGGLEVSTTSAKVRDTVPGGVITLSVVAANRGATDGDFVDQLTLPDGCVRVAPPDLPFAIPAGQQVLRVVAVSLPSAMPAGRFTLGYQAMNRGRPSSKSRLDFAIEVLPVEKLDLSVTSPTSMILAGDRYQVQVRVANRGNCPLSIHLTPRSSLEFPVLPEVSGFTLSAGATRDVQAWIETDKAYASNTSHAVTFVVTATTPSGKILTDSQASVMEIIPLTSGQRDIMHQLPVRVRLTGITEREQGAQVQAEISGKGSLDEEGKHEIDFVLRGPDVTDAHLFGERDEYGASYHGERLDLEVGDRIYSLSPLTERYGFGRGAAAAWHEGNFAAGAFFMDSRYRQQDSEVFGAYLRQQLDRRFSVQANFMRKSSDETSLLLDSPQNIYSLELRSIFGKTLNLSLEGAISRSDDGSADYAYRADARGELSGNLNYALEYVHAGAEFAGYYSNTDTTFLSVNKEFSPDLRVRASLSRYAANYEQGDIRSSVVNRENSWNFGAEYDWTKATELSLEWQHVEREDVLLPAAYDFREESLRFGIAHDFGRTKFRTSVDFGSLDNAITEENGPFSRYRASVDWTPVASQTWSVYADYGPSSFSGSDDNSIHVGASAKWKLNEQLDFSLAYARNHYDGLTGHEQEQSMLQANYKRKNKSSLSFLGRWLRDKTRGSSTEGVDELAALVTYTIPLHVPVSRKRSIGMLDGRVILTKHGQSAALPRVVLQAGSQFAVTDANGHFEFPSLKPGPYELNLKMDSIPSGVAMATPLPMKVNISPAGTTSVELTATPAASLSVSVMRYEFTTENLLTNSAELKLGGPEAAALVEITNGRETWREQTDRRGAVSFERLSAGVWMLRVLSNDPSPLRAVESPERTLSIAPGGNPRVLVRVLPVRRTLRMLDQGVIR